MGVALNGGTPKWMVKIMENPLKMGELGVPPFKETPIYLPTWGRWKMATGFQGEMQVNYTVRPMDPMGGGIIQGSS